MAVSITLWEAYLIESLRSKGMDNQTLLTYLKEKNIQALNELDTKFDHTDLVKTAHPETIKQAILKGYRVKFMTINGLKNLMNMKFGLDAGKDYQMDEAAFYNIPLSEEQRKIIEEMIFPVWKLVNIRKEDHGVIVDIVHASES